MPRKKWRKPCSLCEGKKKLRCMICGWKDEPKKVSEMSNMELAALAGKRNRVLFLHNLDRQSTKAGNTSTGMAEIDAHIMKHREWALGIYSRVKVKNHDPKAVAKDEQLTENMVRRIVQMVSDKIFRQEMEVEPNPPVVVITPPIPPPPPWYYTRSLFAPGGATFKKMEEIPESPGTEDWGSKK
jgi:hypothetical protein